MYRAILSPGTFWVHSDPDGACIALPSFTYSDISDGEVSIMALPVGPVPLEDSQMHAFRDAIQGLYRQNPIDIAVHFDFREEVTLFNDQAIGPEREGSGALSGSSRLGCQGARRRRGDGPSASSCGP